MWARIPNALCLLADRRVMDFLKVASAPPECGNHSGGHIVLEQGHDSQSQGRTCTKSTAAAVRPRRRSTAPRYRPARTTRPRRGSTRTSRHRPRPNVRPDGQGAPARPTHTPECRIRTRRAGEHRSMVACGSTCIAAGSHRRTLDGDHVRHVALGAAAAPRGRDCRANILATLAGFASHLL